MNKKYRVLLERTVATKQYAAVHVTSSDAQWALRDAKAELTEHDDEWKAEKMVSVIHEDSIIVRDVT